MIKETVLRIHTIGNNSLFKYVVANHFGINPEIGRNELCHLLNRHNVVLLIGNIFEEWKHSPNERFLFQDRRGFDMGMHHLKIFKKYNVKFEFEKTQAIRYDLDIIKKSSPPLYDWITKTTSYSTVKYT